MVRLDPRDPGPKPFGQRRSAMTASYATNGQTTPRALSEALLDAILETTDDAVFSHDSDARVTSWNPAAERFFGYESAEVLGFASLDLFAAHLRDDLEDVFATVMTGDRISHYETEVVRKDGMPMPIALSVCPVYDADGVLVASVLIARDITEQRLAQASLAESEVRAHESEALANVGSWLWDLRTGTVQWSDQFHRIHGVEPLDFDGTFEGHLNAVHAVDRTRVRAGMHAAIESGRPFEDEYRVVRPDLVMRLVHVRAQPTVGSAGSVIGLRGIGQDVTDRRA